MATLALGWLAGGGIDEILTRAWGCLLVYAVLGAAAGQTAGWIVDDAVSSRVADELAAAETARQRTETKS